jgi:bla regulator protein blaR1
MQVLFWFNPLLIFYKKAIRLNHEFLADEKVIESGNDATSYQYLLIEAAGQSNSSMLTSRFNFSVTKKRIVMITKNKSFRNALARQLAIIPVIAISVAVFSTRIEAQENPPVVVPKKEVPSTTTGVSQELLDEYQQLLNKIKDEKGRYKLGQLTEADRQRLETIFLSMSKEQQNKQTIVFMPVPPPLPKVTPTAAQIESWKNSKMYGLWINEKRVSNAVLNNYTNTDFSQVFVSKLSKNAVNYGKHYYQVDLMTNEHYETYRRETLAMTKKYFMAIKWKGK